MAQSQTRSQCSAGSVREQELRNIGGSLRHLYGPPADTDFQDLLRRIDEAAKSVRPR
ncbi:hypothetical protein [Sphingobium algorifonticola]|uniref:hypothetical protein n=1 Tax=Sphingobium algorifonticola TaxID=2008318 RepID=UPI0013E3BC5B|nr:hypothetical protein [Sphingobium algorifonticola]